MSLTASQLKFLLEDIETDCLILYMPQVAVYPKHFVFNHRDITIHGYPNIPFSALRSMKSERFSTTLNATDSTIQDLIGFFRRWVLGGMEHFLKLRVKYKNMTDEIVNSVLRGIDEMGGVVNEKLFPPGRRILRPDGKRATVMFNEGILMFAIL